MLYFLLLIFVLAKKCRVHKPEMQYGLMHSVPVYRDTYEPRTEIKASFAKQLDHTPQGIVGYDFTFQMKRPTLRLANFVHITHLGCEDGSMLIGFDDLEHTTEAFKQWQSVVPRRSLFQASIAASHT